MTNINSNSIDIMSAGTSMGIENINSHSIMSAGTSMGIENVDVDSASSAKKLATQAERKGLLVLPQSSKSKTRSNSLDEPGADSTGIESTGNGNISASSTAPSMSSARMRRSWSMLEVRDIQVIHDLQDDMQEMLHLDEDTDAEVKPHLAKTNSINTNLTEVSNDAGDDDGDGFFFFDEEDDDYDDDDRHKQHNFIDNSTHEEKRVPLQSFETDVNDVDFFSQPKMGTLEPICEKTETKKKKPKKGILGKMGSGMKRSVSLGLFQRRPSSSDMKSLDQSKHDIGLDQSQHNSPSYDLSGSNELDQSVHTRSNELDQFVRNNAYVTRTSHSDLQSLDNFANFVRSASSGGLSSSRAYNEEDQTMDTSRHRHGIGSLLKNPNMIAIKYSRSNRVGQEEKGEVASSRVEFASGGSSTPPSLGGYQPNGKKKPSQSILRNSSSMLDLSGQNHPQLPKSKLAFSSDTNGSSSSPPLYRNGKKKLSKSLLKKATSMLDLSGQNHPQLPKSKLALSSDTNGAPFDGYKHCGKKKPARSILRNSSSMLDLSNQTHPQLSRSKSKLAFSSDTNGSYRAQDSTQLSKPTLEQHASSMKQAMKRNISFSTLEIREYNITIGDNPGGRQGPPVSLDWNYCPDSTVKMCIETYEEHRGQRRSKPEMYMSGSIRMWTLMKENGFSMREIRDASKAAESIRKDRKKSIKNKKIHDLQYKVGRLVGRN